MNPESEQFLAHIQSASEDEQLAAWTRAEIMPAEVIPQLCALLVAQDMKIAKAADEALNRITHAVGKQLKGERWSSVLSALIDVLQQEGAVWTKTIVIRHLSEIADDSVIPVVAGYLDHPELREEAIFCLERLPGANATQALIGFLEKSPDDFKFRVLMALAHRQDSAALDAVRKECGNSNPQIRLAALEALARIGSKPEDWNRDELLDWSKSLTPTQHRELMNTILLACDRMVATNIGEKALDWYWYFLDNVEDEHLRCASVVGLKRYAQNQSNAAITPKIRTALETKQTDASYIVQITAQKAAEELKG